MTDPAPAHPDAPSTRPGSRHGRPNPSATPRGNRARLAALVAALVLVSATIACGGDSASDDRRDDDDRLRRTDAEKLTNQNLAVSRGYSLTFEVK